MSAEGRARTTAWHLGRSLYTVRRADRPAELAERSGHYELVEGSVLHAERRAGAVFLNFGRLLERGLHRRDRHARARLFREPIGLDPLRLGGRWCACAAGSISP
jgi:hypothetical protein